MHDAADAQAHVFMKGGLRVANKSVQDSTYKYKAMTRWSLSAFRGQLSRGPLLNVKNLRPGLPGLATCKWSNLLQGTWSWLTGRGRNVPQSARPLPCLSLKDKCWRPTLSLSVTIRVYTVRVPGHRGQGQLPAFERLENRQRSLSLPWLHWQASTQVQEHYVSNKKHPIMWATKSAVLPGSWKLVRTCYFKIVMRDIPTIGLGSIGIYIVLLLYCGRSCSAAALNQLELQQRTTLLVLQRIVAGQRERCPDRSKSCFVSESLLLALILDLSQRQTKITFPWRETSSWKGDNCCHFEETANLEALALTHSDWAWLLNLLVPVQPM